MPKHKKLHPKITRVEKSIPLDKFKYGELELRSLIRFKDADERRSFETTRDLCVEQDSSTDGVDNFLNPSGRELSDGEIINQTVNLLYNVVKRSTLKDVPDTGTLELFTSVVLEESIRLDEECDRNCKAQHIEIDKTVLSIDETIQRIATHLFKINSKLSTENLFGKMMTLFAILCATSIHIECQRPLLQSRRTKLAQKMKAIQDLFSSGLVTGSSWASAAFWEGVRAQVKIEYDSIPENNLFSPFTQTFGLLKDVIEENKQLQESLFNSILYIMDTFKLFINYSGYKEDYPRAERRKQITDRFENLPDHISDPGYNLYTYQEMI